MWKRHLLNRDRPLLDVLCRTIHLVLGYPGITKCSGPGETESIQVRVYTALRDCFTFSPPQLQKSDMLHAFQSPEKPNESLLLRFFWTIPSASLASET